MSNEKSTFIGPHDFCNSFREAYAIGKEDKWNNLLEHLEDTIQKKPAELLKPYLNHTITYEFPKKKVPFLVFHIWLAVRPNIREKIKLWLGEEEYRNFLLYATATATPILHFLPALNTKEAKELKLTLEQESLLTQAFIAKDQNNDYPLHKILAEQNNYFFSIWCTDPTLSYQLTAANKQSESPLVIFLQRSEWNKPFLDQVIGYISKENVSNILEHLLKYPDKKKGSYIKNLSIFLYLVNINDKISYDELEAILIKTSQKKLFFPALCHKWLIRLLTKCVVNEDASYLYGYFSSRKDEIFKTLDGSWRELFNSIMDYIKLETRTKVLNANLNQNVWYGCLIKGVSFWYGHHSPKSLLDGVRWFNQAMIKLAQFCGDNSDFYTWGFQELRSTLLSILGPTAKLVMEDPLIKELDGLILYLKENALGFEYLAKAKTYEEKGHFGEALAEYFEALMTPYNPASIPKILSSLKACIGKLQEISDSSVRDQELAKSISILPRLIDFAKSHPNLVNFFIELFKSLLALNCVPINYQILIAHPELKKDSKKTLLQELGELIGLPYKTVLHMPTRLAVAKMHTEPLKALQLFARIAMIPIDSKLLTTEDIQLFSDAQQEAAGLFQKMVEDQNAETGLRTVAFVFWGVYKNDSNFLRQAKSLADEKGTMHLYEAALQDLGYFPKFLRDRRDLLLQQIKEQEASTQVTNNTESSFLYPQLPPQPSINPEYDSDKESVASFPMIPPIGTGFPSYSNSTSEFNSESHSLNRMDPNIITKENRDPLWEEPPISLHSGEEKTQELSEQVKQISEKFDSFADVELAKLQLRILQLESVLEKQNELLVSQAQLTHQQSQKIEALEKTIEEQGKIMVSQISSGENNLKTEQLEKIVHEQKILIESYEEVNTALENVQNQQDEKIAAQERKYTNLCRYFKLVPRNQNSKTGRESKEKEESLSQSARPRSFSE